MASEILGLFGGQTPQQLRNAFLDSTMVSPQQMAQQGLLQQVVSMGRNAGSVMGAGAGQLLGGKVAGEVEAGLVNNALEQVNKMGITDPALKMAKIGEILSANPATAKQGMIALQEANKLKVQGYKMGAMEREDNYRKDLAALGANPTTEQLALLDQKYGNVEGVRAAAKDRSALEAETKAAQSRAAILTKYLPSTIPQEVITSLSSKASQPIYQAVMKDVINPQNEFKEVNGNIGLYNKRDGSLVRDLGKATPKKGVSVTLPPAETEYSKTVAKGAGTRDLNFVSSAQSVAESLPKMYETANLIATSDDLLTGIGSGVMKDFYRIVDQFTSAKEAGKKVSDTEYLDALMGSEVFTQINALGIGARGLDTIPEREFLRSVMTGTTTLNEETLKKLTNLRITVAERAIKKYNEKLASGQLDRYMKASGEKLEPIEIPKRSSETEITSLISRLKANPQYSNLTDKQAERALRKAGKIK